MNPAQEPTDSSGTVPIIDPKVLPEEQSKFADKISGTETSPGALLNERGQEVFGAQPNNVEDLAVIEAGDRQTPKSTPDYFNENKNITKATEVSEQTVEDFKKPAYDQDGTNAMAIEVSRRAKEKAKKKFPLARQGLIDEIGKQAADNFRAELEAKKAEKQSADAGAQAMLDELKRKAPKTEILSAHIVSPVEDTTKMYGHF